MLKAVQSIDALDLSTLCRVNRDSDNRSQHHPTGRPQKSQLSTVKRFTYTACILRSLWYLNSAIQSKPCK